MNPTLDLTRPLEGQAVALTLLGVQHAHAFSQAYDPNTYRFMALGGPADGSLPATREYITRLNADPTRHDFAIVLKADGQVAGRISLLHLSLPNRQVEIGTLIFPMFQGAGINPDAKLVLLRHMFEEVQVLRVQFTTDTANVQSRRALEKLGAVYEGLLRQALVTPTGDVQDRAVYSVIRREWPEVAATLASQLKRNPEINTGGKVRMI